jgi:FkbM family methyltransferase
MFNDAYRGMRVQGRVIYDSLYCRSFPDKETLGTANQWTIRTSQLNNSSVVYSGGVGGDISFELDLVQRFGCNVFLFDPSPLGIATIESLAGNPCMEKIHFFPLALADRSEGVSFEVGGTHDGQTWMKLGGGNQMRSTRIGDFMRSQGHTRIDLFKLDIEGFEYGVIESCLEDGLKIPQICLEFHHFFPDIPREKTQTAIRRLKDAGYSLIHKHMYDFTFQLNS